MAQPLLSSPSKPLGAKEDDMGSSSRDSGRTRTTRTTRRTTLFTACTAVAVLTATLASDYHLEVHFRKAACSAAHGATDDDRAGRGPRRSISLPTRRGRRD
jgi:hypothetical protein